MTRRDPDAGGRTRRAKVTSATDRDTRVPLTPSGIGTDLRGTSQLIVDGVVGVTGVVESMHRNIAGLAPVVGASRDGATTGITGLVYRSVRGVTRVVGGGVDVALARLAPFLRGRGVSQRREAVAAALNGVLGDYLVASGNPLAIAMQLRQGGHALPLDRQALVERIGPPSSRVIVLAHGLCMSDLQWQRNGHDHGPALAALGYTPLYLHYNSGLHVASNGRGFAALLEQLIHAWPVPVTELVVIGHSMGGLVARSARHYARIAGHAWPARLRKLVFLGTPHHGAPLERAGHGLDTILGWSPYTAPFARLGKIRSAGVQDMRYGTVARADGAGGTDESVPLPRGVRCYAIAATTQKSASSATARLRGDGLVPVRSALGQHADPASTLAIPASRQRIVFGANHFDLLDSAQAYAQLQRWLGD